MASYYIERNIIYVQGNINGKRVKRSTKKEANKINLNWIKRANLDEVLSNLIDKKNKHIPKTYSLEEFGLEILELGSHKRSSGVQRDYVSAFKNHILPYFQHYRIEDIKTHDIEIWQKKLLEKYASRTVDRYRYVLGLIISKAYANDMTHKNYHELAEKVSVTHNKKVPYTIDEMKKILNKSRGWFRVYIHLAFTTGMRVGELLALKKTDIDFDNKLIHLQRSISKGVITIGLKKSDSGKVIKNHNRLVIVPNFVLDMLKEHVTTLENDWLFPSRTRSPYTESKTIIKRIFKPLLEEIRVEYKELNTTRHTYISLLRNQGVNKTLIQDIVGHVEDSDVTDKHYTQLEITDYKIQAVNNMFKGVKFG